MKALLIYDDGCVYDTRTEFKEFYTKKEMIDFINKENIGILACYEIGNKIEIEAFEKVIQFRIKK